MTRKASTGVVILLRSAGKGSSEQLSLTVPRPFHDALRHLVGRSFQCELTDDGVLFRLSQVEAAPLPAWAREVGER